MTNIRRQPDAGFSLIELMVVMVIVIILASVVIPAVGKVRSAASAAQCLSNMRQIGAAVQVWSNDNDGNIPFRFGPAYESWIKALAPYMGLRGDEDHAPMFVCPGVAPVTAQPRTYVWNGTAHRGSAVSSDYNPGGLHRKMSSIVNPANTAMVFDIWYTGPAALPLWGNHTNSWRADQDGGYPYPALWTSYPRPHYDNKAVNLLFYDGHVARHDYPLPDTFYYLDE